MRACSAPRRADAQTACLGRLLRIARSAPHRYDGVDGVADTARALRESSARHHTAIDSAQQCPHDFDQVRA
jgi:hypothetical protein